MIMIKNLRIKEESWDDNEGFYMTYKENDRTYSVDSEKKYKAIKKGTRVRLFTTRDSGLFVVMLVVL